MKKRHWIFPAISCLLLTLVFLETFSILGLFLFAIWFIRIVYLKDKETLRITILISLAFLGAMFIHENNNDTSLTTSQQDLLVYPVASTIKVDGDRLQFDAKTTNNHSNEEITVRYYLQTEAEKEFWSKPTSIPHVLLVGELVEPSENTNFYQFNYKSYLKRRRIHWQFNAESIKPVVTSTLKKPWFSSMENIRMKITYYIDQVFHEKIASYLKILFLGDRRDFSEEVLQNYRTLGVVHLFSISGFHITFLVRMLRWLLLRVGITHEATSIVLLVLLPFYGGLAGFGVSVFRAVFQSMWLLIGDLTGRRISSLNACSLTMLLALFVNPFWVYDISFQLSYTLSGIFIFMGQQEWTRRLHPIFYSFLFSSLSTLMSLPILAYHFFEISWVAVFMNLLFIPLFTYLLFPILFILLFVSPIFKNFTLFLFLNELIGGFLIVFETMLAQISSTYQFTFVIGRLPSLITVVLILAIIHIIKKIEHKERPATFVMVLTIICLSYHQLSPVGYVLMLDVGQGDSIVVKEPGKNKVTLIDTGGRLEWQQKESWQEAEKPFTIGGDIVVPSLKALGIDKIDRLYLTHADEDHMGEIANIGKQIKIEEIASTKDTLGDNKVLKQIVELENIKLIEIVSPQIVNTPVQNSLVLQPIQQYTDKNNQSLVIYVKIGNDFWLFTGDIETEAENDFVKKYSNLKVDYLKIAHHGSKTSSTPEFIEQISPKYALISAGVNNSFNHPNDEVIETLLDNEVEINLTATDGAIMVKYLKIPFFNYWLVEKQTVK